MELLGVALALALAHFVGFLFQLLEHLDGFLGIRINDGGAFQVVAVAVVLFLAFEVAGGGEGDGHQVVGHEDGIALVVEHDGHQLAVDGGLAEVGLCGCFAQ